MLNFPWLAEILTGRKEPLWGMIPPLKTVMALIAFAVVMAAGMWLWVSFWTGVHATFAAFIPMVEKAVAATVGLTLLNFWFSREINAAMLSTRDVRDDVIYGPTNPVDVNKMVNHLCHEVNAYFKRELGQNHRDMSVPVLLTYTDDANFKIITVKGRNRGKSAIIFTSGTFDMRRMNQRQLAALIEKELVKIYLYSGFAQTFVGMLSDLATTLKNLNAPENAWYFRFLAMMTGPLQLVLLWERSISRSYEYDAVSHVIKIGRGPDLVDAMDRKVCPTQLIFPMKSTLKRNQRLHKRDEYKGRGPIKSFADWVDRHEYPRADKTGWRFISYLDCKVNYSIYLFNEVMNPDPRSTHTKQFALERIEAKLKQDDGSERVITMDSDEATENPNIKKLFYDQHREINRKLYDDVKVRLTIERERMITRARERKLEDLIPSITDRLQPYKVIDPDGTGWVCPILDDGLKEAIRTQVNPSLEEQMRQMQAQEEQIKQMQAQMAQMQAEFAQWRQVSAATDLTHTHTPYRQMQQQQSVQPPPPQQPPFANPEKQPGLH